MPSPVAGVLSLSFIHETRDSAYNSEIEKVVVVVGGGGGGGVLPKLEFKFHPWD